MAVLANFPFFTESVFGVLRLKRGAKPVFIRLAELLTLYLLVLGVAYLIESSLGNAFAQGWQFYATTGCLFIVLAFPGYVFRYLRRRTD